MVNTKTPLCYSNTRHKGVLPASQLEHWVFLMSWCEYEEMRLMLVTLDWTGWPQHPNHWVLQADWRQTI